MFAVIHPPNPILAYAVIVCAIAVPVICFIGLSILLLRFLRRGSRKNFPPEEA